MERKQDGGALFKNERKEKEKQPDYTGHIEIGGVKHALAAWLRKSEKTGKPFMSLKVSEWRERTGDNNPKRAYPPSAPFNDDIPF